MKTSQSLNELRQHLELGTLDPTNASRWLRAEVEAVARLEAAELAARQALAMVCNHHLAGVPIMDHVRKLVDEAIVKPEADAHGNHPCDTRGHQPKK